MNSVSIKNNRLNNLSLTVIKNKSQNGTSNRFIFNFFALAILLILLNFAQSVFAQNPPENQFEDPLEDEEQYQILTGDALADAVNQRTGHPINNIEDFPEKANIKYGMISDKGIWLVTKDDKEHVFIQKNKQSPPVKIAHYSEMSDIEHFGLQERVKIALKNYDYFVVNKLSESPQIHKDWQNRVLDITKSNETTNITSKGSEAVREQYNKRMTKLAEHLKAHLYKVDGFKNLEPEAARMYSNIRRELGKTFKEMTPAYLRPVIYARNFVSYGDMYGPTYRYLKDKYGTHQEAAVKSIRTGDKLFGYGFGTIPLASNKNEPIVKGLFSLLDKFKNSKHTPDIPDIPDTSERRTPDSRTPDRQERIRKSDSIRLQAKPPVRAKEKTVKKPTKERFIDYLDDLASKEEKDSNQDDLLQPPTEMLQDNQDNQDMAQRG